MWLEASVDIPMKQLTSYTDKNQNVECKSVVMHFNTFRHETIVYRAKQKMKPGLRAIFDLMKIKYTLLTDNNKVVKQNHDIK